MLVISTRDFRSNQTKFLSMAKNGNDVVLKSREMGSFKIVPIRDDDTIVDKKDVMAELKGALQQVKEHLERKNQLKSLNDLINEL